MTGSALATAALWSYGLAAAGYVAFALRLALGWRRSPRATLLLAAVLATALWAVAGMAVGTAPASDRLARVELRSICSATAAGSRSSRACSRARAGGDLRERDGTRTPRSVIVLVVVALLASVALSEGSPWRRSSAPRRGSSNSEFASGSPSSD